VFVQWVQAYDVDASSVRTIYATLASVFPHVETWDGLKDDLLLVASRDALVHDVAALRLRVAQEPFASALRLAWYTDGIEGFLAHFVANDAFTHAAAEGAAQLNTDDVSPVEFGFARSARGGASYSASSIFLAVEAREDERPDLRGGQVDWGRVDFEREAFALLMGNGTSPELLTASYRNRLTVLSKWSNGDFSGALAIWNLLDTQDSELHASAIERLARAELLAYEGSIESERAIARLLQDRPTEAAAMHAVYLLRHGRRKEGTVVLRQALQRYRGDPWPYPVPLARALNALQISEEADRELAPRWLEALAHPFALRVNETARERARLRLSAALGAASPLCVPVFEAFEPYPPWSESMLQFRAACYETHEHPLRDLAARELLQYRANAPVDFEHLLAH
jgi:spermidine synthase